MKQQLTLNRLNLHELTEELLEEIYNKLSIGFKRDLGGWSKFKWKYLGELKHGINIGINVFQSVEKNELMSFFCMRKSLFKIGDKSAKINLISDLYINQSIRGEAALIKSIDKMLVSDVDGIMFFTDLDKIYTYEKLFKKRHKVRSVIQNLLTVVVDKIDLNATQSFHVSSDYAIPFLAGLRRGDDSRWLGYLNSATHYNSVMSIHNKRGEFCILGETGASLEILALSSSNESLILNTISHCLLKGYKCKVTLNKDMFDKIKEIIGYDIKLDFYILFGWYKEIIFNHNELSHAFISPVDIR